jgi:hypothetical protein
MNTQAWIIGAVIGLALCSPTPESVASRHCRRRSFRSPELLPDCDSGQCVGVQTGPDGVVVVNAGT